MASKKKVYKGVAITAFTVGTKNPKSYKKGDDFKTNSKLFFDSLVNLKKVK